ncbi:non-ribosomal peptide synthetase, partial [Streptomyces sp. URMC 127]|uniref:non-ribosomal peptide synthetase n=1 Tax=Streptomyces sp. URMC 127 TaxID=3423402 RepID=UPI003F1957B1
MSAAEQAGQRSAAEVLRQVENLPPEKRAALWRRLWERGVPTGALARIHGGAEEAPASFTQRRMVFLHRLDPASPAYNCPAQVRLTGRVSHDGVEAALNAVARRHAVLRARLPVVRGEAVQRTGPPERLPLPVIDLTGLPPERRAEESDRLVRAEQEVPFDLENGPLIRFVLVRLAADDCLLLLNFHHAVADGWSFSVFSREFGALYEAHLEGRPDPLPEPRLQYADYARWQQDWLHTEEAQQQIAYWLEQLAGAPPLLTLPTDRPRSATVTRRSAVRHLTLPPDVRDAVARLARQAGATPFMVLLAAFQIVLARFSGQDDVLVGTPVSNRRYKEFHELIGFFVNSVVLRGRPRDGLAFEEYLREVRATCLAAYDHQDIPVDVLARRLHPDRELGRNPIYQVNLAFHNTPEPVGSAAGMDITPLDLDYEGARFDLDLVAHESGAGLECSFIYAADLFDASLVDGIATGLETLLGAALADPATRLADLPLLGPRARREALDAGRGPRVTHPGPDCVHRLFEEQARRTPGATAVLGPGDEELTYRRLDTAANAFAHLLRDAGARRGSLVAVLCERGPRAVTALLGVLKAGAAYLPLDPAYPRARLEHMLRDSGARLLVTGPGLGDRLDAPGVRVLRTDAAPPPADAPPAVPVTGDDLLYVMYTSGSSGGPKGVLLAHRQVANYLRWAARTYRVHEGGGVPLHSSLAFDLTVTSIFAPLLTGQRLVLRDEGDNPGEALLAHADRAEDLSMVKLTPSHLRMLDGHEAQQRPGHWARTLVVGGEALHGELLARWRGGDRPVRVFNEYGPTETAVACTAHEARDTTDGPVPIGTPLDNTHAHVLDDRMRPVPAGVTGELYIGGAGVSYGYLGRGALTAERFVPDPFSGEPGARLYRTGDLARRLGDGSLLYLGRADQQVKIRGHRIEPDEITAVIDDHPRVLQSVVAADRDRLVAFVSPRPRRTGDPSGTAREEDRVGQWRMLYDDTYGTPGGPDTLEGWDSSYTGRPIDPGEMKAWLEDTVERVRALRPRRVLEIGCGTGMILSRTAPGCDHYRGTDLSAAVIGELQRTLGGTRPGTGGRVELLAAPAHRAVRPGDSFDTVILNSVVQYFPSVDYLLTVLDQAVGAVPGAGHVFLGDLRSLPLLDLFHTSVTVHRAAAGDRARDVRARIARAVHAEEELALDPRLFTALRHRYPRLADVRVLPKAGRYRNELSCFRYDVVLALAPAGHDAAPGPGSGPAEDTRDGSGLTPGA